MKRKEDPWDDFTVVSRKPTAEEDRMMREFMAKDKAKRAKTTERRKELPRAIGKLKTV